MASPADRMNQRVSYASPVSRDSAGKPTLGAIEEARARVEQGKGLVRDREGNLVVFEAVVFTDAAFDEQTRVWLPGYDASLTEASRRVIKYEIKVDGAGKERFRKCWVGTGKGLGRNVT